LIHERFSIAILIAMNIFKSGSDEKFSIKVCRKNFNQGLVDPESFFNRDPDRDENFKIKP